MITISKAMAWFLFSGWVIIAAAILRIIVREIRKSLMGRIVDRRDKDVS